MRVSRISDPESRAVVYGAGAAKLRGLRELKLRPSQSCALRQPEGKPGLELAYRFERFGK